MSCEHVEYGVFVAILHSYPCMLVQMFKRCHNGQISAAVCQAHQLAANPSKLRGVIPQLFTQPSSVLFCFLATRNEDLHGFRLINSILPLSHPIVLC